MSTEISLEIVIILTVGFALAGIFGYITHYLKLSPILGYLIAGYIIGPYSPGFVANTQIAEQLAEIGVILMMFGVGLHFKLQYLLNVKSIVLPGALFQVFVSTLAGAILIHWIGWSWEAGILYGFSISVASTVVLVRMLSDQKTIDTEEGHVAVGWLIVEDLITIAILILIPNIAGFVRGDEGQTLSTVLFSIGFGLFKFVLLAALMFTIGRKVVIYAISKVMNTHSHELFTVAVLALTFVIAAGSAFLFGTSIALGAFLAGMVMGQASIRRQVTTNSLPMKDAFVVIFFLSVGMIFNPAAIFDHPILFTGTLAIILLLKPLAAFLIIVALRYPLKTALTVAIALAQIGEFSFIVAEEAMHIKLLPDEAYDVIVACALIAIALNPILFNRLRIYEASPKDTHIS
jgi:monovalent cation:H+ antiporter-2, CPA2 family